MSEEVKENPMQKEVDHWTWVGNFGAVLLATLIGALTYWFGHSVLVVLGIVWIIGIIADVFAMADNHKMKLHAMKLGASEKGFSLDKVEAMLNRYKNRWKNGDAPLEWVLHAFIALVIYSQTAAHPICWGVLAVYVIVSFVVKVKKKKMMEIAEREKAVWAVALFVNHLNSFFEGGTNGSDDRHHAASSESANSTEEHH